MNPVNNVSASAGSYQGGDFCLYGQKAEFRQRTAAILIDFGLLLALHLSYFSLLATSIFKAVPLDFQILLPVTMTYVLFFLAGPFILVLSYFTVLHAWGGQTVGKIIMGIKVSGAGVHPISTGRAFLRATGYFLSALPFGAGFLWAVLDRDGKAWHDLLAGTRVVQIL